ncbi:MAG: peptidoglycan-associated lipoprotein Pal [Betaproteobacteria bacterium]|nr:peptidoglycan-associated lipoprotein Pal [Betaproteobacteria bacterium]
MNKTYRIVPALAAALLLAACGSTPKTEAPAPVDNRTAQPPAPPPSQQPTASTTTPRPVTANPLDDPRGVLAGRSVFFDYDSNVVKPEGQTLVKAHADYMKQFPGARIALEGNTDERGSREYNLALGQRRADAVKQIMTLVGVSGDRIETVSFGEEKPKAPGHDEAAWSQNRRADIVYKVKN